MRCPVCQTYCQAQPAHRVGHIRQEIAHTTDGPLTPFTLISRAMELSHAAGRFSTGYTPFWSAEDIANALHEELTEHGWIVDEDDVLAGMPAEMEFSGS